MNPASRKSAASSDIDLAPLRSFWHPVEDSAAVGTDPVPTTLLGEDLVLFRSGEGIHALPDCCPHRGTRLSLGRVDGDGHLVCPYHGWAFDSDGCCVRIPAQDGDRPIPSAARTSSYRIQELYGLVWVALDEPTAEVVPYPEFDDDRYRSYLSLRDGWNASAGRFTENGLDVTHFAWVHPGTLGDRDDAESPDIHITTTDFGFEYSYSRESLGGPFAAKGHTIHLNTIQHMPFTRRRELHSPAGHTVQYITARPTRARECEIWMFESRDHQHPEPETYNEFFRTLVEQDRRIVESQRPEMLPVDLTEEIHLKGPDQVAITYRRCLAEAGLPDV